MVRKTLVTFSFAFEVDEDDLPMIVNRLEDAWRVSFEDALAGESDETVGEIRAALEFYGATVSPVREAV